VRFDFAGIAAGQHAVWVAGDALDRRVFRIDPRMAPARLVAKIPLSFSPGGIAAGDGGVWVTAQLGNFVAHIDPTANQIGRPITVGRGPTGVAVGAGAVWVANTLDDSISRIDLANRAVRTIPLRVSPKAVTVASDGTVWVAADAG